MPSKIKAFNFNKCQHLRKLLINKGVEIPGRIDLTDTPIKVKNDIDQISDKKFRSIPEGVSIWVNDKNKIKLATATNTIGIQTDPVEIAPLSSLNLTDNDKEIILLLKNSLFWFNNFKNQNYVNYLKENQKAIKEKISITGLQVPEENVRLLAEHVLMIVEKLIENKDYFNEVRETVVEPSKVENKEKQVSWGPNDVEITINTSATTLPSNLLFPPSLSILKIDASNLTSLPPLPTGWKNVPWGVRNNKMNVWTGYGGNFYGDELGSNSEGYLLFIRNAPKLKTSNWTGKEEWKEKFPLFF